MIFNDETGDVFELVHERLQIFRSRELDQLLTVFTDQVMTVLVFGQCVSMAAVIAVNTPNDSEIDEQLQGAVHGNEPDCRGLLASMLSNRLRAQPTCALSESVDHGAARGGDPVALAAEPFDDLLRLSGLAFIESIFH
jgi:hypothetical protein